MESVDLLMALKGLIPRISQSVWRCAMIDQGVAAVADLLAG